MAVWGAYFNASGNDGVHGELNGRTVDAILAFMPSQPIWAMHGSAYGMVRRGSPWPVVSSPPPIRERVLPSPPRQGDFSNNAKWMVTGGWEREGGHYRAGLNSIPLVERFRLHPDDLYLLHVGLGGVAAVLPNFDASGAPSMAYHTYPFVQARRCWCCRCPAHLGSHVTPPSCPAPPCCCCRLTTPTRATSASASSATR